VLQYRLPREVRQQVRRLQVRVHDHVPGAFVDLLHRTVDGIRARVVDEDVDAPEALSRLVDDVPQLLGPPHVGGDADRPAPRALDGPPRLAPPACALPRRRRRRAPRVPGQSSARSRGCRR
jgi:hypothetical protein